MKNKLIIVLFLSVSFGILFFSCSGSNKNSGLIKQGKYSFLLSDSLDNKMCDGALTVESTDNDKLIGKYEITKKYVDKIKGISSSDKGYFEGTVDSKKKTIFINMNPKLSDANLFINAHPAGDSLIGDWNYSTMMGIQQVGKFKAVLSE